AADRPIRVPAGRTRGRLVADRFRNRLLRGVHGGRRLHPAADGPSAASRRARRAARRSRAGHRPHARNRECRTMSASIDIAIVWAFIIAFTVFVYVVMDGFDLGLGILFPLFSAKEDRDTITNSVAPVWDGNETWLVLGGGGLMAAFPLAYA